MNNNQGGYKMLDKVHLFTKSKGMKNKYHCPVCGKNDFEVKPSDGTYKCFSTGCSSADIRAAIDALEGKTFAPGSKTIDRPTKSIRPKSSIHYEYPNRDGSKLVRVARIDDGKGGKPIRYQEHWDGFTWQRGVPAEVKPSIAIYRYAEVQQAILDDRLIFVVEGEPCANALWNLGIPATTTIAGTPGFATNGDYSNDFDGGRFVLSPDCDTPGIKYIASFAALLGDKVHGYYLAGSNPDLWVNPAGGFDIKDDITDRHLDRDRILANVISADEYQKILNPVAPKPVGRPRKPLPTPVDRDYQQLAQELGMELPESGCDADGIPLAKLVKLELDLFAIYGNSLEFNEMSCEIELDRSPIDMDGTKSFVAWALHSTYSQQDCDIALNQIAKRNRYSPVKEYLESVRGKSSKDFITNIPERYWGNVIPLQNYLFFKKMIACVARVMQPGCADHNLLILNGGQGAHKSMALSILSGEQWFTDDLRSIDDKDELAKLSRFWLLELAEVDYLFGKKETELFKRFLSGRKDTFRPPYGRSNISKPRTSALFATTNKSEFLNDPTGSRRYWVVDVESRIDTDALARDRDLLWAAALDAYESGVQWWLEDDLEIEHREANERYQEDDIWQLLISEKLGLITTHHGSIEYTTINLVADRILNIATDKQDYRMRTRIAKILRSEGFDLTKIRSEGKQVKVWGRSTIVVLSSKAEYHPGTTLKSLPTTINTYETHGTYSSKESEKKIKNTESENKIINNYSLQSESSQVPDHLSTNNAETVTHHQVGGGTHLNNGTLQPKPGDRVKGIYVEKSGVVDRIGRHPTLKKSTAQWARVIMDGGIEWWAELDIITKIE